MATAQTPPAPRAKGDQVSLVDSFRRLAAWLKERDAAALMQTLAPGAKPVQLSKLEGKLGFRVPPGLRALWLMHDGQRKAADSLVGTMQLLPVAWVLNERPATLKLMARVRAEEGHQRDAGLTREEARSDEWLPIAKREAECVLVHSASGRVFGTIAEAPYLRLLAKSVPAWLESYVNDVEHGNYELVLDAEGAYFQRLPDDEG
jgi:cell wall assembly regulator SMI1